MNISIQSSVFTDCWKIVKVTPVYKSGDKSDVNNYLPRLLSVITGILERHVHIRFYTYLSENNLLSSRQSGFRTHHSAETALVRIVDDLLFNLDNNKINGVVLIDYCKAFHMAEHDILLKKMEVYGVSSLAFTWFQSYLTHRQQGFLCWK